MRDPPLGRRTWVAEPLDLKQEPDFGRSAEEGGDDACDEAQALRLRPHCWLVLSAPTVGLALEYQHATRRLLKVLASAYHTPERCILGGLAFELGLARRLLVAERDCGVRMPSSRYQPPCAVVPAYRPPCV